MSDLVVIVPSRGRPQAAVELAEAFQETCTASTHIALALDQDDPQLHLYGRAVDVGMESDDDKDVTEFGSTTFRLVRGAKCGPVKYVASQPNGTMVSALNMAAEFLLTLRDPPLAIGFLGDDHRPRTQGWDQAYLDALREMGTGIVYGNDLLQGEALPTQCAMTSDIIRELGFMAPPQLVHLACDNWWRELGRTAGCIKYLPDVIVEHMHPAAGKAEWDEGHKRVNAPEMYDKDLTTFAHLQMRELPGAAVRVRRLYNAHRVAKR